MPGNQTEHREQTMFFQWIHLQSGKFPELASAYAIPNAAARSEIQGALMKREGLRTGFPDVCIPVACGNHSALYLEFKRDDVVKLKPLQEAWAELLEACGNRVARVNSCNEAIAEARRYILQPIGGKLLYPDRIQRARARISELEAEAAKQRAGARVRKMVRQATAAKNDPTSLLEIAQRGANTASRGRKRSR